MSQEEKVLCIKQLKSAGHHVSFGACLPQTQGGLQYQGLVQRGGGAVASIDKKGWVVSGEVLPPLVNQLH